MGGQKFQYDESGGTFFYFILSFLALILIPATFYYWPRKKKEDPRRLKDECQCPPCMKKRINMSHSEPYKGLKSFGIKMLIIGGWALLAFLTYKVSQFDYEMSNFDPYEILQIEFGASDAQIKRSYRKLSVIYHPDKETGDAKEFMRITKAYKALTDEEAKKNWDKYGNPDGPGAMSFGIALPSWIVEKENSVWVLGLYALVFMVALPVAVGTWWYRSIRFSGDKVLLDTTQMYFYFFHKTELMEVKRIIMILAASMEFNRQHNSQVVERQSDNEEVPLLIKQFTNLNEKCKEPPLCRLYSIKARAIIHAHLGRIPLNPETLEKDRQLIVQKCPYLIQEMVSCVNQLIMLAYARRISRLPNIESIENCMRLSQMITQGLWEKRPPLLQLPYLTEDHLKYFMTKKRHIKNLQQLAQLPPEDSRAILKNLSDYEYENLMRVLGRMPLIDFSFCVEVIDDEHTNVVTAGAIVTVTVTLMRRNMKELFGDTTAVLKPGIKDDDDEESQVYDQPAGDVNSEVSAPVAKKPSWQTKKKGGGGGGKKKAPQSAGNKKETVNVGAVVVEEKTSKNATPSGTPNQKPSERKRDSDDSDNDSDMDVAGEDDKLISENEKKSTVTSNDDDDMEWEKFQRKLDKRKKLEGKSKVSHPVHCPYFPEEKQEYWWTYICDRKSHTLLTAPYYVTNLVDQDDIQLKFTAPRWPGEYVFEVCLRSDSYMGMDQSLSLKLDVKEAAVIPTEEPEYGLSESEDEEVNEQLEHESEFTTDSSDEEAD